MYTVQLQRGTIDDLKSLLSLIHEELDFTKNYVTAEEIDKRLEERKHGVWLAKDGSKPIGTMVWYEDKPKIAYAWIGAIRKDYQNNGLGNLMFDRFMNDIINSGYEKIWAKVGVGNIKTLNLFIKYNFRISRREMERGNDIFLLEKNLSSLI